MKSLVNRLEQLGFSEKESAVYVALLQLGKANVSGIARKSSINRATVYNVLETLKQKGLVIFVQKGEERCYVAEPPERLVTTLKMQADVLKEKIELANDLKLSLQAIQSTGSSAPKIRYIETLEGLELMQREFEERGDDILQIVGYDNFLKLLGGHEKSGRKKAIKTKTQVRSILVTDREISTDNLPNVEILQVSPSLFKIGGEMTVAGNRLVLFSYMENLIAIEITSQAIADTAKATLELAWQEVKRLNG